MRLYVMFLSVYAAELVFPVVPVKRAVVISGQARRGVLREGDGHRAAVSVQRIRCRAERMRIAVERQVAHRDAAAHLDYGRIVGLRRIGSRAGVGEGQGAARSLLGIAAAHIRPLGAAQAVRGERVGARELEGHRLAVVDRVRGRAHLRQGVHRRALHGLREGHRAR